MTLLFRNRINRLHLSRKDQYNASLKYHDELRHKYYNIYGVTLSHAKHATDAWTYEFINRV